MPLIEHLKTIELVIRQAPEDPSKQYKFLPFLWVAQENMRVKFYLLSHHKPWLQYTEDTNWN